MSIIYLGYLLGFSLFLILLMLFSNLELPIIVKGRVWMKV